MRDNVINFVLFQIGWFACVLSAAAHTPMTGAVIAGAIIALHLWRAAQPRQEMTLLFAAMLIGAAWDSLLVAVGWLGYTSGVLIPGTAPYWIVIMWALFATTLNLSLRWMKRRYVLAAVFGAIAGPLAYAAGAGLGAVQFIQSNQAFAALTLGWAMFTPLLLALTTRFNGYALPAAGELAWK